MKRIAFSIVFALCIALCVSVCAFAQPTLQDVENTEETNIEIMQEENKAELAATEGYYTYTVSNGKATITDCDSSINGDVVIPATIGGYPVTSIGSNAFYCCTGLASIDIPDSVTSIGDWAFEDCTSLVSIDIPDSVTSIGSYAFRDCKSLESIDIPDSVTSIGNRAFYNCTSLESIDIPDSVTSIGSAAFSYCASLESITVDSNNAYYSSDERGVLFNKNKTTLIQYPAGNSATSYDIPDSVTSIGSAAFSYCASLASIDIPDSVTSIGSDAFYNCTSLESIDIPDSVTSIGSYAFINCTSLESITVDSNNAYYSSDERGVLFNKNKTTLIQYPAGNSATSYDIPDSVTSIGSFAFYYCTSLASVTFGENSLLTSIGSYAFYICTSLASIDIPDSVTSISSHAFSDCRSLVSVTFGENSLLTSIGSYAFYICTSLASIDIPDSVTSIGGSAFYRCTSLKDVYYTGTEEEWNKISIGSSNDCLLNAKIHYSHVTIKEKTSNSTSSNAPIIKSVRLGYKGKFYDVVNQTVNIEKGSAGIGNIYVDVAWNGTAPSNHKVYLTQGANTDGENNTFVSFDQLTQTFKNISLGTMFEAGKPIYIVAIDTTGPKTSSSSLVTKINIVDLSDNEVFENAKNNHKFSLGKDIAFTIPKDVPVFGGTELTWELDFIPITIKSEDGKMDIVYGMDLEEDEEFSFENFKKDIDDYVDVLKKKSSKQNRTLKQLRNDLRMSEANKRKNKGLTMSMWGGKVLKNSSSGDTDTGVDVLGYARAEIDKNGNIKLSEGYICFEAKVEYTYNGQVFIWVIPCYYTFGGSVGGKADITIQDLDFKDFSPKIQSEVSATVGAKIGGGIGVPKVACFGAEGNGDLTLTFNLNNFEETKNYQKVTVGASAEFNLTVLGQKVVSKDIWELDEDDGIIYSTYPEDADKTWIKPASAGLMSVNRIYEGYSAENVYETEKRDVSAFMQWIGNEPQMSLFSADYTNKNLTRLADNVYHEAQPQIVSIDGTKVLIFTTDNTDRDIVNKQMLVYSIYDDTEQVWSEPLPVNDDGTADFYPSVCGEYLVWHNQKTVLDEGLTLAEIGMQGEIVIAKWNGNGFDAPIILTDNNDLDTLPKIAVNGDEINVVWLKNSANDILGVEGTTSITKRTFDGTEWSDEVVIKNDLNTVSDLSVGYYNNTLNIAYVHDTDDDITTVEDREIYLISNDELRITDNEVCDTNTVINKGKLYWYSESNIYYYNFSDSSVNKVFEQEKQALEAGFTVSENNENIAVLWSGIEKDSSEIKGVLYQDGSWGDIITVSELGANAKYPTCVLEDDGTILTSFTAEADNVTSLYTLGMFPSYDLTITDVYFTETNLVKNSENEFEIAVTNCGELLVDGFVINIYNQDETINNSIVFDDTIIPGETKVVKSKFITSDSIVCETMRIEVQTNNDEEYIYDNNYSTLTIGNGDVFLENITVHESLPTAYVVASITNIGYSDVDSITVNLRANSVDGEIVQSKDVSSLQVGATEEVKFAYTPTEYENVKWYITTETESDEISVGNNNDYFINELREYPVDFEHSVLSYTYADNVLTINTFAKNNTNSPINGTAYLAVYNNFGKMKRVTLQPFAIGKYSDTGIDMWISDYKYEVGDYFEVFAWDDNFAPLCLTSTANIQN